MRGHEEASGVKYVPKEMFAQWIEKDPIKNYERFLLEEKIVTNLSLAHIRDELKEKIESELKQTSLYHERGNLRTDISSTNELNDVYAPSMYRYEKSEDPNYSDAKELRFVDAIKEGLRQSMTQHPNLILMGQDIAEYGGAFKVTEDFVNEFGKERVRNTPLCESAIVGAALGLSVKKYKAMVEMQFSDFVTCGFNQIVNNLAKIYWRWGQNADVVVRMPTGAGVNAGPFHSQSNEAWFVHTPGLKVVYPAFPTDAKGLLLAAVEDPNP